jgi:ABC-2 type transport system ATP-binding protein
MNADDTIIHTINLTKTYKGVNALKSVNLKVARNSIFGFLGPNGAGKTTTIRILLGLARPTAGQGLVFGQDVVRDSIAIRRRTGYLAQDPHYYGQMSAREVLRFTAGFFYAGPNDTLEARIEETLDLVGLDGKADRPVKNFSGGERQRLGIAQAQINYPDLLILDEPAASLDPMGRHDVLEVMERLRKHTTIFYSTHILEDVQRVSDTVAILNHGELIAQAPIDELLSTNGTTTYTLEMKGNVEQAHARLAAQPWVLSMAQSAQRDGHSTWQISVKDPAAAEANLMRVALSENDVIVTQFGEKHLNLEEVFLSLVEGDQNGR